jgi:TRAP-type transport system small permease protein
MTTESREKVGLFVVFEKVVRFVVGVLLTALVVIVFSNVLSRYVLNSALAWSEEIGRIVFIYLVFFVAILAYIKNEHLGLDLLVKRLPARPANLVVLAADLLVLLAIGVLAWGGFDLTRQTLQSGWTSPVMEIPYGYIYLVVPLCGSILFVQAVFKLASNLRSTIAVFERERR